MLEWIWIRDEDWIHSTAGGFFFVILIWSWVTAILNFPTSSWMPLPRQAIAQILSLLIHWLIQRYSPWRSNWAQFCHSGRLERARFIACHNKMVKAVFCFAVNSWDWRSNGVHYEAYSSGRQYLQHACSSKRSFNLYRYNTVSWWTTSNDTVGNQV